MLVGCGGDEAALDAMSSGERADAGRGAHAGDAGGGDAGSRGAREARAPGRPGATFAGERWSWMAPLWRTSEPLALELAVAVDASIALDDQDRPVVAWLARGAGELDLRIARIEGDRWQMIDEAPLARFQSGDRDPAIHVDGSGAALVSWVGQDRVVTVRSYARGRWSSAARPWVAPRRVESLDLAASGDVPVLAVIEGTSEARTVHVLRYDVDRDGWAELGSPLDPDRSRNAHRVVVAAGAQSELAIAWLEHDGYSDNLYVARRAPGTGSWTALGAAADIELDARAGAPALALAGDGELAVSWSEGPRPHRGAYVARWTGRFQVLGGALDPERASDVAALALDSRGRALALVHASAPFAWHLSVARYEGGPTPPFGLASRPPARCAIPPDSDPRFPQTLSATGCFDDVPARIPTSGLLPYGVNSPLWSDGTLKRRFLTIPDGETIGYTERDAWSLPVGTVLVKEFLLELTPGDALEAVPVETRFLVKRCEPGMCRASWQGYSYQWNDAGTDAHLLDNEAETVFKDWLAGDRMHRHSYPGRDECTKCHASAPGGALGIQTGQLHRNHDYGHYVDDQIRALGHIGLLGPSFAELDEAALESLPRLPAANDPAYPRDARVRSYLHANCSHCHRPDGRWPVADMQFEAPLRPADEPNPNICDLIVPGDPDASLLFAKIRTRGALPPDVKGDPMPPVATLVPDARQLANVATWIEAMASCP